MKGSSCGCHDEHCGHEHHGHEDCGHGHGCCHDHERGCGCGHGGQSVVISMEDGSELRCNIITVFGVAETDYIAMQTVDGGELMIFRYYEDGAGQAHLDNIKSDDEFDRAAAAFSALLGDDGFDADDFGLDEFADEEFMGDRLDDDEDLYTE